MYKHNFFLLRMKSYKKSLKIALRLENSLKPKYFKCKVGTSNFKIKFEYLKSCMSKLYIELEKLYQIPIMEIIKKDAKV